MTLREVAPELGELKRWAVQGVVKDANQASGGNVPFIAICRMMFGYRVRAGWTKEKIFYVIDWCMGAVEPEGQLAAMVVERLAALIKEHDGFDGIPAQSQIKPLFLDLEFMAAIGLGRKASQES